MKKLIIFDLDGTLAESKSAISTSMASSLKKLLQKFSVAIISGGNWNQFQTQLLANLNSSNEENKKLFLLPTSGTSFYSNPTGNLWEQLYSDNFSLEEITKIYSAFEKVFSTTKVVLPAESWGDKLENRGSQVTFSALGQQAPVEIKKSWDPNFSKRLVLIKEISELLPEFDIKTGGSTSIDVTKKGIDKAFGIQQLDRYLHLSVEDMLFVGDALFPGGNDYPVTSTGVECIQTSGPEFTIQIIEQLIVS
jgi:hypothetical protein